MVDRSGSRWELMCVVIAVLSWNQLVNTGSPRKAELEVVGACAASLEF